MFDLLLPGTPVTLKGDRVETLIVATKLVMGGGVRYKVRWWACPHDLSSKRRTAWVDASEVKPVDGFEPVHVERAEPTS